MQPLYDVIGAGYRTYRRPDPRIQALIDAQLGDAVSIVNLGAGTGSYEPRTRRVVAVEPSRVMIDQRPSGAAPVVQAQVEALPFGAAAFAVAMTVLTIHHWADLETGLREARRVARQRVVLLTWIAVEIDFWLFDYVPRIREIDQAICPSLDALARVLGPLRVVPVPIPHDCTDGFLCAYWRRPHSYLDAGVRSAISTFARIPDLDDGLRRLRQDLESGRWRRRYGSILDAEAMDFGYRLVVADGTSAELLSH